MSVKKAGKDGANISMNMATSLRTSAKSLQKQPRRTFKNTKLGKLCKAMAAAPRVPPLFGLRVEFSPGNKDKSHQRWTRLHSRRFLYFKIFTLSSMQRGFFHTCRFHLREKSAPSRTALATRGEQKVCFEAHLLVTTSSWLQQPWPPGSQPQHLWGKPGWPKSPTESWRKPAIAREPVSHRSQCDGWQFNSTPSPAQCPRTDTAGSRRWHSRGSLEAETHSERWIRNVGLVKPRKTLWTCMWSSIADFKSADYGVSSGSPFASFSSPLDPTLVCNILPALCASISLRGQHDTSVPLHHGVRNWEMSTGNI